MSDLDVLQRELELWYSPDWCDWRWRIRGCSNSNLWTGFYIFHTIWAFLAAFLGFWAIYKKLYQKVWRKKLRIFDYVEGGIRPRAAESFILFATIHILGRAIYTSVILGNGFGSNAAAEFFHEIPWTILYIGGVCFTVGIIYATPRHQFKDTTVGAVRLPSRTALNLILLLFCILPLCTLPVFAALDGHARDTHQPDLAKKFNSIHYGLWSTYCWALAAVALYFGVMLVRILRKTIRDMASINGDERRSTDSGAGGEFRRAILTLVITVACTFVIEIAFAVVLLLYAILRTHIQSLHGVSAFIGFIWIFVTPAMLTPIFVVMLWGVYKNKEEQRERSRNATSDGASGNAANGGTTKGGTLGRAAAKGLRGTDSSMLQFSATLGKAAGKEQLGSDPNMLQLPVRTSIVPANSSTELV